MVVQLAPLPAVVLGRERPVVRNVRPDLRREVGREHVGQHGGDVNKLQERVLYLCRFLCFRVFRVLGF